VAEEFEALAHAARCDECGAVEHHRLEGRLLIVELNFDASLSGACFIQVLDGLERRSQTALVGGAREPAFGEDCLKDCGLASLGVAILAVCLEKEERHGDALSRIECVVEEPTISAGPFSEKVVPGDIEDADMRRLLSQRCDLIFQAGRAAAFIREPERSHSGAAECGVAPQSSQQGPVDGAGKDHKGADSHR